MTPIKVMIADDHKIIRVGLRGLLEHEQDIEVIGEAEDAEQVLSQLKEHLADVILMDIDLGEKDGIITTREIKSLYPEVQVLGLTMHEEPDYVIQMLQAGASGYLLKNAGRDELLAAIRTVSKGDSYFSKKVSATLLEALSRKKEDSAGSSPKTDRKSVV